MFRGAAVRSLGAVARRAKQASTGGRSRQLHKGALPLGCPGGAARAGSFAPVSYTGRVHGSWIQPAWSLTAARGFAVSHSDTGLLKVLKAELEHEESEYEAPQDLQRGPPSGFELEEKAGTMDAVLRKMHGGERISVVAAFADEDSMLPDEEEDEEGAPRGDDDEEEEGMRDRLLPLNVRVTVEKRKEEPALEIDCLVDGNSWLIHDVRLADADVAPDGVLYAGPAYATLDPMLQEQFDAYLSRRGVTGQLAQYLRRYLEDKEQREYMRWLKRLGAFVALK